LPDGKTIKDLYDDAGYVGTNLEENGSGDKDENDTNAAVENIDRKLEELDRKLEKNEIS
jgi:hypothetical protein